MDDCNNKRLLSLDVFRGFDMMFIMGVEGIIVTLCSLFPGGDSWALAENMNHVEWDGLHFMDTVFPTFLFIAGVSFPFSLAKQKASGMTIAKIHLRIFRRAALLVVLGCIYNGVLQNGFENPRICSVLGRIGLAWMLSALLFLHFSVARRVITLVLILISYWLLLRFVPAPDSYGADALSFEGNLAGYIDRSFMPGSLYNGTFDPEGLIGVIPATATAMLGMFTGMFVRGTHSHKVRHMLLAAVLMLCCGLLWNLDFPVNKNLWSSSFVLVVGSWSLFAFAVFYWIIDVKGCRWWILFFQVIGMNSITIYMLQRMIDMGSVSRFFLGSIASMLPDRIGALVIECGYVFFCWLVLYFLYKKNTFLKI